MACNNARKQQREQDRADVAGMVILFAGAIAIVIGLFVGPSTFAACIAGAWGLYVLGLISMESETAREVRGVLLGVTAVFGALGGIGYFLIGTVKADEALSTAGASYMVAVMVGAFIFRLTRG